MGKSDPNIPPSQLRDRDGATVPAALGVVLGVIAAPKPQPSRIERKLFKRCFRLSPGMDPT